MPIPTPPTYRLRICYEIHSDGLAHYRLTERDVQRRIDEFLDPGSFSSLSDDGIRIKWIPDRPDIQVPEPEI